MIHRRTSICVPAQGAWRSASSKPALSHPSSTIRTEGACETLRHNIRRDPPSTLRGHVSEGDLSRIDWISNGREVRLLAAGTPCQPFSRGGAKRGHADERNLFPTILKAVRVLRPRAVLIENVRGLERGQNLPYLEYVLSQIQYPDLAPKHNEAWEDHARRLCQHSSSQNTHPSYRAEWAVFNAADFGVPQIRYRLFIVATAVDLPEYRFPTPTHSKQRLLFEQATGSYWARRGLRAPEGSGRPPQEFKGERPLSPWVTVRDAIGDLPRAAS